LKQQHDENLARQEYDLEKKLDETNAGIADILKMLNVIP